MTMRNRIKYFSTDCNIQLSLSQPHILEYHYTLLYHHTTSNDCNIQLSLSQSHILEYHYTIMDKYSTKKGGGIAGVEGD